MAFYICTACGTQHAESKQPPTHCVICEEERQYIPPRGQTWTTLDALRQSHTNTFHEYEKASVSARRLHLPLANARCSCARITAISYGTASPRSTTRL